jgi:hypothetical protein
MAECRSCGATITWAVTESGRRIPLDAQQSLDGNMSEVDRLADGTMVVAVVAEGLYRSHFATCPQADDWRRKR